MRIYSICTFFLMAHSTLMFSQSQDYFGHDFTLLSYQDSTMEVDLGVGLWAWPMPMDFDLDGDLDLVVSCPDVPYNGTYFFENDQDTTSQIFKAPVRLGFGDKNFQVSYKIDEPLVTRGSVIYDDFRTHIFQQERPLFSSEKLEKAHQKIRFKQWKILDYEGDGDMDLIAGMDDWGDYGWDNAYDSLGNWTNGPQHGYVYLVENDQGEMVLKGKILAAGKPVDVYGAPSPNFADFDRDGDLDLICGEFMDKLNWFENSGTRQKPVYEEGRYLENEHGLISLDLQMIIPVSVDWDRDGYPDLIVGDEDGRVAFLRNSGRVEDGMPIFATPTYLRQYADYVKFGALVTPFSVDWDDDGDEDLICGNTAGYIGFLENLDGQYPPKWAPPVYLKIAEKAIRIMAGKNGSIQGPCEAKWGYTTLSVADWDHDGLKDIIVNSIWGKIIWFKNIGVSGIPALDTARAMRVKWIDKVKYPSWNWWKPGSTELATQWRTTPYVLDWNGDKLMDLVMLDHEGYLAYFERFQEGHELWLRPGQRIFYGEDISGYTSKHQIADSTAGLLQLNVNQNGGSGRRKFCFSDWDLDGDLDLLINSNNTSWLENTRQDGKNTFFTDRGQLSNLVLAGHTTSPTIVDWDKNGIPDLLIGAEDGHFYYLKNKHKK